MSYFNRSQQRRPRLGNAAAQTFLHKQAAATLEPLPPRPLTLQSSSRVADDRFSRLDVARDDCPGADKCSSPDADSAEDDGAGAERYLLLDDGREKLPVACRLKAAVHGRSWVLVVDEENTVADEHASFDLNPCADERVALNLAIGADAHSLLNGPMRELSPTAQRYRFVNG
jgi:hypothetical protein